MKHETAVERFWIGLASALVVSGFLGWLYQAEIAQWLFMRGI